MPHRRRLAAVIFVYYLFYKVVIFENFLYNNHINKIALKEANAFIATLSFLEFDICSRLSNNMTYYHDILHSTWDQVYADTCLDSGAQLCSIGLIDRALRICQHVKAHHDIEEAGWFPLTRNRMEMSRAGRDRQFSPAYYASEQHKTIHEELEKLMAYLEGHEQGKRVFKRELREMMDSLGQVLWQHLDHETAEPGVKGLWKYWTGKEVERHNSRIAIIWAASSTPFCSAVEHVLID